MLAVMWRTRHGPVDVGLPPDAGAQLLATDAGLGLADVREQHGELVAAEPRPHVGGAQLLGPGRCRRAAITRSPAAWPSVSLIVLKSVDVEQQQRAARPRGGATHALLLASCCLERAAGSAGPVSGSWSARWRRRSSARLRASMSCIWTRKCCRAPVAVAHERRAHEDPHRGAAMDDERELLDRLGHLAGDELARAAAQPRHVVRQHELPDVAADEVLERQAGEARERAVRAQDPAGQADDAPCRAGRRRTRGGTAPRPGAARAPRAGDR